MMELKDTIYLNHCCIWMLVAIALIHEKGQSNDTFIYIYIYIYLYVYVYFVSFKSCYIVIKIVCLPSILRVFGRWDPQADYKHTEGRAVYWTLEFLKRSAGTPFLQFRSYITAPSYGNSYTRLASRWFVGSSFNPNQTESVKFLVRFVLLMSIFHLKSTSVTHDRQILSKLSGLQDLECCWQWQLISWFTLGDSYNCFVHLLNPNA